MTTPAKPTFQTKSLPDLFAPDPTRFNRVAVVQAPGLQVLHLSLAPGQAVPRHNHPGYHVVLQGLRGAVTVSIGDDETRLEPGQVLHFSGRLQVEPRNDAGEPAAMLITLAKEPA